MTAPSAPGLAAVLADLIAPHDAYRVNEDGWTVCICGHVSEGDDDDGSHARHVAPVVLAWLTERLGAADVVEAAQRAYTQMQRTRDDDPAFQGSMTAALAAAVEALTGEVDRHV